MNLEGRRAEELCAGLLQKAGLRILARNWRCRLGEIDLVAEEAGTLVFAEVRLRRDPRFGGAALSGGPPRGALPVRRDAAGFARAGARAMDPRCVH